MVILENLNDYSLGLQSGKYKSEEVVAFFRQPHIYGNKFSAQDLNIACRILGWKITRRSGKSDIVSVK